MRSPAHALDAVIADIRDHPITTDHMGLYNVTRHIELLCHLVMETAADAEYQMHPNIVDLSPAETLAISTAHLGKAIAHYTQTLVPLVCLPIAKQETRQEQQLATEHRGTLHMHLDGVRKALADASNALMPHQPADSATPVATAPKPPHASGSRGRS